MTARIVHLQETPAYCYESCSIPMAGCLKHVISTVTDLQHHRSISMDMVAGTAAGRQANADSLVQRCSQRQQAQQT